MLNPLKLVVQAPEPIHRVYRVTASSRLRSGALGLLALGLGVYLVFMTMGHHPTRLDLVVIAVEELLLLWKLFHSIHWLSHRLVLTENMIEIRSLLGTRRRILSECVGFYRQRRGWPGAILVGWGERAESFFVPKWFERWHEIEAFLAERLPEATRGENGMRRDRIIYGQILLLSVLLLVLGLAPAEWLGASGIEWLERGLLAGPFVALLLLCGLTGHFRSGYFGPTTFPRVSVPLFLLIIAPVLRAPIDPQWLDYHLLVRAAAWSAAFAAPGFLITIALRRLMQWRQGALFYVMVMWLGYGIAAMATYNRLGVGESYNVPAELTAKIEWKTIYDVMSWDFFEVKDADGRVSTARVGKQTFSRVPNGSGVQLVFARGKVGIPWLQRVELAPAAEVESPRDTQ